MHIQFQYGQRKTCFKKRDAEIKTYVHNIYPYYSRSRSYFYLSHLFADLWSRRELQLGDYIWLESEGPVVICYDLDIVSFGVPVN